MDKKSKADLIKQKALQVGFDKVGIAKVEEMTDDEKKRYEKWFDNKYYAKMYWLANTLEKRLNPKLISNNFNSVIVVSKNYFTNTNNLLKIKDKKLKISRYALGKDYHLVLRNPIRELADFVSSLSASTVRWYVDSGPVFEKYWAQKSGIGWIGKNSLIITKEFGSWIFIGVILTDLELEADVEHENYCDGCTQCVKNCPTGAIDIAGGVNCNKCISYWTTVKEECWIPDDVRQATTDQLYGCDLCQEVCPWNKFAKQTDCKDFYSIYSDTKDFSDILTQTEKEFNERFKQTPIRRIGVNGLKRNLKMFFDLY